MKKILLILLLLPFFSRGQIIQKVNTYGYEYNRFIADTLLAPPYDTLTVPAAYLSTPWIARKGMSLYFWNTVTHVWTSMLTGGSGTVTSVASGNGMNFSTITGAGTVTMGTPSSVTLSSTNSLTSTSHTHAFAPGGTTSQYIRGDGSLATYGTATGVPLSGVTAMTGSATIDNLNFAEKMDWSTLTGANPGLWLNSTSTTASSNNQQLLTVTVNGATANASQTTRAVAISNQHTGTGSDNIGAQITASGGVTNTALTLAGDQYAMLATSGKVGIGVSTPTAFLHLRAGATTASTAPLKFTSGSLNTTAEAGAVEFLTDAYYGTITTGAARKTFAFLESPVFTGTVTIPTPFTLGATSVTATGTQLNYINAATGTTGTASTNIVYSTSPTLTTSILTGSSTFALLNTTATTVNAFGAATTLNIGASAATVLNFGGSTTASELRFLEPSASGTNYSSFKAIAQAANLAYTFPPAFVSGGVLTDAAGNGTLTWSTPTTGITGVTTFGSTPNANGLSVSGANILMQPADGSNPGGVSTTTQTFAGAKTFSNDARFNANVGIGRANTGYLLDAYSATYSQGLFEGGTAADILLRHSGAGADAKMWGMRSASGRGEISSYTDVGAYKVQGIISWSNTTGDVGFVSNVGIGTATPTYNLTVAGGTNIFGVSGTDGTVIDAVNIAGTSLLTRFGDLDGHFGGTGISTFSDASGGETTIGDFTGSYNLTTIDIKDGNAFKTILYNAANGHQFTGNVNLPHLIGNTSAPTIAAGTGAGTTPTVTVGSGSTDLAGYLNITTGTIPAGANATVATITFNVAYGSAPTAVILTPANSVTALLSGITMCYVDQASTSTTVFVIKSGTTALTAATAYKFFYTIIQ